jgi:hypothetical protein
MIVFLAVALFLLIGCSSPDSSVDPLLPVDTFQPLISSSNPADDENSMHGILGVYQVTVDSENQNVEILPARNSQLDMQVNLNPYLVGTPCRDCLQLKSIGLDSSKNLLLDFGLTHAFQDASVRPDLNGFDLRGIIVLPGTHTFPLTPKTKAVFDPITHLMIRDEQTISCNHDGLLNPDGYTALWDYYPDLMPIFPSGIAGTINPYKNFFWEDNPDPLVVGNPIPWRTFYVGGGWDYQRYIIDTSKLDTVFSFYFIADVSYGKSATFATRHNPFYRNPQFNMKAAYDVQIETAGDLLTGDTSSSVDLTIYVRDWQAGAPLVIDPLNPGRNEIDAESDVFRIAIEAPDFQTGLISIPTPDSGSGSIYDPYIFRKTIRNLNGATTGFYPVLVSIEDDLFYTQDIDARTFKVLNLEVVSSQTVIHFNPPERVTNNEHASFVWTKECIAIDSSNNPHVVWTDDRTGYHQVYYSTRSTGGSWSAPENISQSTGQAYYPTIAIDSLNRSHIVWEDSQGIVEGMNIHYGLKTGPGLASEVDLTNYDEQVYGYFPKIVVNKFTNVPHIVWMDNKANGGDDYDIRYVKMSMAVSPPVPEIEKTVSLTTFWDGQPTIALNSAGEPRVLFIRDEGSVTRLMFSKLSGGDFSTPSIVDNGPAYWPDVEISNAGAITTAFHGGSGLRTQIWATYSTNDGTSWIPKVQISESSSMNQAMPDLVIDSTGVIHMFWTEIDSDTQVPGRIKYRQYSTSGLSAQQDITPPGYPSAFPSAVVDSNNALHVAFETYIDDNYEIYYLNSVV